MDNQHRKISGYRELSQTEIDLMNRIKLYGPELEELVEDIRIQLTAQYKAASQAELLSFTEAEPYKWLETGKKELQIGLMYLTRAVAQPEFF